MTDNVVHITFPKTLYNDLIRFSDGRLDPSVLAENLVLSWIENTLEFDNYDWGERLWDVANAYAPNVAATWRKEEQDGYLAYQRANKPLAWKEIEVASGSDVRMSYGGEHHYAVIHNGSIKESEEYFTPSQWASKIAGGTARNAWRDIWFKEPLSKTWVPAELLRAQAKEDRGDE